MKTKTNFNLLSSTAVILAFLLVTACSKSDLSEESAFTPSAEKIAMASTSAIAVPFFIEDANSNNPVTGNNTPLYTVLGHNPIIAPNGHHVTLGEYNTVEGRAQIKCLSNGTHVTLNLSNLIPNGTYTIWTLTFQAPGFDGTLASLFANLTGVGAFGLSDGSANTFVASASGKGQITRIVTAGNLSEFGSIGSCVLSDEFEVHFIGAYHLDGNTYGPTPGPDGSYIEHFGFIFKN